MICLSLRPVWYQVPLLKVTARTPHHTGNDGLTDELTKEKLLVPGSSLRGECSLRPYWVKISAPLNPQSHSFGSSGGIHSFFSGRRETEISLHLHFCSCCLLFMAISSHLPHYHNRYLHSLPLLEFTYWLKHCCFRR